MWWLLAACAPTGPLVLELPLTAARVGDPVFAVDGHTITLTEAVLSLTDLRMEGPDDDPSAARRPAPHPGHDLSGAVQGELLGRFTVDLLDDPTTLGVATCWAGTYASARLTLDGAPAARLVGTVRPPEGAPRPFAFDVTLDERAVTGVPFAETLDEATAGLQLGIDPSWMLSFADWSTPDTDGTLRLTDGVLANSVPFGIASTTAWSLTQEVDR